MTLLAKGPFGAPEFGLVIGPTCLLVWYGLKLLKPLMACILLLSKLSQLTILSFVVRFLLIKFVVGYFR
jgi:hypothetical protein